MNKIDKLNKLFESGVNGYYDGNLIRDLYKRNYVVDKKDYKVLIDPIIDWFNSRTSSSLGFSPDIVFSTVQLNKQDLFNYTFKKNLIVSIENTLSGWNPISGLRGENTDSKIPNKVLDFLRSLNVDIEPYNTIQFRVSKSQDNRSFTINYTIENSNDNKSIKKSVEGTDKDFKEKLVKFFNDELQGCSIYSSYSLK